MARPQFCTLPNFFNHLETLAGRSGSLPLFALGGGRFREEVEGELVRNYFEPSHRLGHYSGDTLVTQVQCGGQKDRGWVRGLGRCLVLGEYFQIESFLRNYLINNQSCTYDETSR